MYILYSAEAWGDLSRIENDIRAIETKALKSCLGVKSGTTTDLIYTEINIPDIVSVIKDTQYKFAERIKELKKGEALVKEIWDLCILPPNESPCHNLRYYYENLEAENTKTNIEERRTRVQSSEQSMCIRYKMIIGSCYSMTLYNSCLDESKRVIITRW